MILPYVLATIVYIPIAFHFLSKGQDIPYSYVKLKPTELLTGYDEKTEKPIVVDMLKTPHLLITGLSGQGKSRMVRTMLLNIRNADIIICNAYKEDYKKVRGRFINGEENIKVYLKSIIESPVVRERPLYIVFEELATIKDKDNIKMIKELLCIARHYNIFIVGVIQIATKEELKFKSYFNARLSFRQLDDSAYRVVLCTSLDRVLNKREFALLSDSLYYGRTYNIN